MVRLCDVAPTPHPDVCIPDGNTSTTEEEVFADRGPSLPEKKGRYAIMGVDWDGDGTTIYSNSVRDPQTGVPRWMLGGFEELLKYLTERYSGPPVIVATEATFDSYELERLSIMSGFRDSPHQLRVCGTRCTDRKRQEWGLPPKKDIVDDDGVDAVALLAMLVDPDYSFYQPTPMPEEEAQRREDLREGIRDLRRWAHNPDKSAIGGMLMNELSWKCSEYEDHVLLWDDDRMLPDGWAVRLDNARAAMAGLAHAALGTDSIQHYESVVGMSQQGYPNIYRSEYIYHGWRQQMTKDVSPESYDDDTIHLGTILRWMGVYSDVRSQYRRGCRWLFHRVRALVRAGGYDQGGAIPEIMEYLPEWALEQIEGWDYAPVDPSRSAPRYKNMVEEHASDEAVVGRC